MRMICEQILFASRVYEVPLQNISLSFTDIESFQKSYHRIPVTIPRIVGSAVWNELWNQEQDIFLYTSDAKFNTIPEAVIGRMAIDNIAIAHAKNNRMIVVDITNTGKHILKEWIDSHDSNEKRRIRNTTFSSISDTSITLVS